MAFVRLGGLAGLVCGVGFLAFAGPAEADLLRCKGPDGKIIFTDKADVCPGADPFEPTSVIQTAPTPERAQPASQAPSVPGPDQRRLAAQADAAEAHRWRMKKQVKQEELERIAARREELRPFVGHCNRGGYVLARDEAGIKRTISCSALRGDFASLDQREAEVREYLQSGLKQECRRAGCLPGWIR